MAEARRRRRRGASSAKAERLSRAARRCGGGGGVRGRAPVVVGKQARHATHQPNSSANGNSGALENTASSVLACATTLLYITLSLESVSSLLQMLTFKLTKAKPVTWFIKDLI